MKLHHLRDLLAIAERGSIRAAAKQLGLGQPGLSRSVRDLEKEVGVPLLERHGNGSLLTPMGKLFVERAKAAVGELRRARDEIDQYQGAVHGTVVVCISSLSHIALLPDVLRPFKQRFPLVQLRIIEGVYPVVEARLTDGTIDFYVGPEAPTLAPGLVQQTMFSNNRIVLARKGHPLGKARSLRELTEADWITTSITESADTEFNELFTSHGLPAPHLSMVAESALTWITVVANSDTLAISPMQWADSPLLHDLIEPVPVEEELSCLDIVMIRRSAMPLTPAAEHLADLVGRAAEPYRRGGGILKAVG